MRLKVNWDCETEYFDIDPDCRDENQITETQAWWSHLGDYVYYQVSCTVHESDDGCQIKVKYEKQQQTDPRIRQAIEDNELYWGVNTITVNHSSQEREVSCTWRIDDGTVNEGWPPATIVRRRLRITREQWKRESRFRENVLAADKRCVISREVTREVLDAAHLQPVKEGGEERVENGFILRTDIHRLYDRGMFLIDPTDGKLVVADRNLSKSYKQLLCHSRLPPATLQRVREALEERWKKP